MNEQLRRPSLPLTSQAAEGLPRRRWSVAEIEAMTAAGIIEEDERFELIGGEVVPMNPKGIGHELLKVALARYWLRRLPDHIQLAQETTFRMNDDTFVEPDFVFYTTATGLAGLKPETALLAVEVADSSLAYDLGRKARLYANFGIRELWVVNANTLITRIHRAPGLEGYGDVGDAESAQRLAPVFCDELAVILSKLTLV